MTELKDKELREIFALFSDKAPADVRVTDTGRGEKDFRHAAIFTAEDGERLVIKLSDNDFTSPKGEGYGRGQPRNTERWVTTAPGYSPRGTVLSLT